MSNGMFRCFSDLLIVYSSFRVSAARARAGGLKSCNWETSTPSAVSLRRTGKRKSQGGGRGGQRLLLALPTILFLAHLFLNAPGFRFPLSALRFQVSAFQRFSFLLHTQASESSSVTTRSLLLGFSIAYSTRSQSSDVRWVCCWREVISIRRRTK